MISYRHAYELVTTHGETGLTARLLPFTVDGLISAASMLILDASRPAMPVPPLARWCLGGGIAATIGATGPTAWATARPGHWSEPGRALALAGSFELFMTLIRSDPHATPPALPSGQGCQAAPIVTPGAPPVPTGAIAVERTVRAWHTAGRSQRAIAHYLGIDRRKTRIIDHPPDPTPPPRDPPDDLSCR